MKYLSILVTLLCSLSIHASLLGSIEGKNSHVYLDILDYQPMNTVALDLKVDGDDEARYRHLSLYLSVDDYMAMFNSEKNYDVELADVTLSATGPLFKRHIVIEKRTRDDNGEIAQKELVVIKLQGDKASVNIKAFRRKKFLFYVGSLKQVSENSVSNINVIRKGVELFSDNRGWPLGRVLTLDGLINAVEDTSTSGLLEACEADCKK